MPIQQALTFIWVALREADGVNIKDVADNLGISQASASRNVNAFMKINRYRRTGHDLIETHEDQCIEAESFVTSPTKAHWLRKH